MSGNGDDAGWNNTGTYIGVGGLIVAFLLYYMRVVRGVGAAVVAAIAIGAGWYMQSAKVGDKAAGVKGGSDD